MKTKFTTAAQATKAYPDAIQIKTKHVANAFTEAEFISMTNNLTGNQYRILFCKIGKYVSRVVASKAAKVEYEARFQEWLKTQPKANMTIETMRVVFDAMDDKDK